MATPIRIKRSAVPGKRPTVDQLLGAELAYNTFDAELYALRDRFSQTGIATEVVRVGAGASVTNILYVTKDGNDNNTGLKLGDAKATIAGAVSVAAEGDVIRVSAGSYSENNPIALPPQVSIVGDSLREVAVSPQNPDEDLFHVAPGNYISDMSFTGTLNPGKGIVSFNPTVVRYSAQSPYIRNCTNFIRDSIGLKIDGSDVIGPFRSMVVDSFTQYNPNGIGASITNGGYAQLVSLFTINSDIAVFCGSGGACDLTNSNSSFGNYGLVADGVGAKQYTGILTGSNSEVNDFIFEIDLNTPTLGVQTASYDNITGILTVTTTSSHNFNVGMGVTISGLEFSCPSGPGIVTYPSGNYGYIFQTVTVAPGIYVDAYNLIQANRQEIIDSSYDAIGITFPSFVNPSPEKCKRDIGYIVDAVSLDVRDFTSKNTLEATKAYFNQDGSLLVNGVDGEIPQTIVGFTSVRDLMKLAITNNLTNKDLTIAPDPITGSNTDPASCANIQSFIDNLVGIITTRLDAGNIIGVNALPQVSMASTVFSVYVGPSTLPHSYESGGTIAINVVRPFDGQAVYFDDLYYTVGKITITNPGSGYNSAPTITIGDPSTANDWGVGATAVAEIRNGSVVGVEIVSSGRGYTSLPTITFSAPDVGINTATATLELLPTYYTIQSSTPPSAGICTITLNENVPYVVGVGTEIPFFKQSRVLASGHSFEYIGSGTDLTASLPSNGGVPIQENETDARNGGLVVYTSTDQAGNFRIGDGVQINQVTGTISGTFYSKSLFATLTPFILALGE